MTDGKKNIIPDGFYDSGTRARFFEAIGSRRSVRAYAGAPDEKQRERLENFCASHAFPGSGSYSRSAMTAFFSARLWSEA